MATSGDRLEALNDDKASVRQRFLSPTKKDQPWTFLHPVQHLDERDALFARTATEQGDHVKEESVPVLGRDDGRSHVGQHITRFSKESLKPPICRLHFRT